MAKLTSTTPQVPQTSKSTRSQIRRAKRRKLESDHLIPQIHIRPEMIKKYGTLEVHEISYDAFKLECTKNGWTGSLAPTSETGDLNKYKYVPADRYDLEVLYGLFECY